MSSVSGATWSRVILDRIQGWETHAMTRLLQYRIAAGADLQQAVQVETAMEHAPAAYRDLLKVVPMANRESYQGLRVYTEHLTVRTHAHFFSLGTHVRCDHTFGSRA